MPSNRADALKAMLAQDPNNVLVRYGLAMEHVNAGDLAEAVNEFRGLLREKPDYAAAYYHCAQTLEKLGRFEEARAMYEEGIEVTSRIGDRHTMSELQAALDLLGDSPAN
jgi:predicted Zn-dependent protease